MVAGEFYDEIIAAFEGVTGSVIEGGADSLPSSSGGEDGFTTEEEDLGEEV